MNAEDREVSLSDIAQALKRRRSVIATMTAIVTGLGILYAIFATPLYTATIQVRPVLADSGGAASALRGQLGAAAALAGINLGAEGGDKEQYMAVLRSRELAESFIQKNDLMPQLFPKRWDAASKTWKEGRSWIGELVIGVSRTLASISGDEGWREFGAEPTLSRTYDEFLKIFAVNEDATTGNVTVSFEFRNPELAARWANAYVEMANVQLRDEAVTEGNRALAYLNEQGERTTVQAVRTAIYRLVEDQLKRVMLANSRPEYAFKVVDRAAVPEDRSHPRRALIVVFSLIFGGILGTFVALAVDMYKGTLGRSPARSL